MMKEMTKFLVCVFAGTAVRMVTARVPEATGVYDTHPLHGELHEFEVCDTSVGDSIFHTDVRGHRGEYCVLVNDITYGDAWQPDEYCFIACWKQWVS